MPHDDPHQLAHWVHRTLLGGLVVSAALLIAGIAAMLAQDQAEASRHESLFALLRAASRFDGPAVTSLGLLALMVTPILRVVVLMIGWSLRQDWLFAGVALVVFALLIASLSLGVG